MEKRNDRACGKADILEPEPDVEQHTDRCHDHRHNSILPHLGTDGCTDIFCGNLVFIRLELTAHCRIECLTLIQIQCLCLEDHLAGAFHLLHLYVVVPGYVLDHRNDFLVDLL